jgi:hypothetical protein
MRYLRFKRWLDELAEAVGKLEAVYFEGRCAVTPGSTRGTCTAAFSGS